MSQQSPRISDGGIDGLAAPVLLGIAIVFAGTIPRNILVFTNFAYRPDIPWSVPFIAIYIGAFWCYLAGMGPPRSTSPGRAFLLRAKRLPAPQWIWSLTAGVLGLVALVFGLRLLGRMVHLPEQTTPDLSGVSTFTMVSLLLISAPVAGIVEEAAFRGYMQGPLERRYGLAIAILITGTMFAVVHLDFTPILWPYYVAVAAVYGTVTYLTGSILPAVLLHTGGNIYSNFALWLYGRAEWQTAAGGETLVWESGMDSYFITDLAIFMVAAVIMIPAFMKLAGMKNTAPLIGDDPL